MTGELVDKLDKLKANLVSHKSPDEEKGLWHLWMASECEKRTIGSTADNIRKAIIHQRLALEILSPTIKPACCGEIHATLGHLFLRLNQENAGVHADNDTTGILHLQKSLEFYTEQEFPKEWSTAQHNLGVMNLDRSEGNPKSNAAIAIQHFNMIAESSIVEKTLPVVWANTLVKLADVYAHGVEGIPTNDARKKEIECCTRYLTVSNEESEHWLKVHHNLAWIFRESTAGDPCSNAEKSLEHIVASMAGMSLDNMMPALSSFAQALESGVDGVDYAVEEALVRIIKSLRSPPKESDPAGWAAKQIELGVTCLKLFDQRSRSENVEKAIGFFKSAVNVFGKESYPEKWADVQMQICDAYIQRVNGDRYDNMAKAISYYEACKEVRPDVTLNDELVKRYSPIGPDTRTTDDAVAV